MPSHNSPTPSHDSGPAQSAPGEFAGLDRFPDEPLFSECEEHVMPPRAAQPVAFAIAEDLFLACDLFLDAKSAAERRSLAADIRRASAAFLATEILAVEFAPLLRDRSHKGPEDLKRQLEDLKRRLERQRASTRRATRPGRSA